MSEFAAFCRAHGLILDHVVADGRWHRTRTEDKPRKRNGAYILDARGGAVRNYATMDTWAIWRSADAAKPADTVSVRRAARQHERERHERAKRAAQALIQRARLIRPADTIRRAGVWIEGEQAHPYLIAKGFPKEAGLVVDGALLVPMYDLRGSLVGAQTITAAGEKRFLPGTRAKGAVHILGASGPWWLVEGYATGLSVRDALARMYAPGRVCVCFSAGNVEQVARDLGNARVLIVADNDASGAGERAALATGRPYVMPPHVGMDANDLHRSEGIRAVVGLLRQLTMETR